MQVVQTYISWRDCPVSMISLTSGAADAGGADVHLVERLSSANASVAACRRQASERHVTSNCHRRRERID